MFSDRVIIAGTGAMPAIAMQRRILRRATEHMFFPAIRGSFERKPHRRLK